ncbi:hypothetical protein FACS1894186_3330 [Alphaproteobacteria bacterium]|nr:hypothetical protein FACS1894186_3330 [Alphaproteobacteria bacterium]
MWTDEAVVIGARPHGENDVVAALLTRRRGLHLGLVHGGRGRRKAASVQLGTRVAATWKARREEALGFYALEETAASPARDKGSAIGLTAACGLVRALLPEREENPAIFEAFAALMADFTRPRFLAFEAFAVSALGYGSPANPAALPALLAGHGIRVDLSLRNMYLTLDLS